MVYVDPRRHSGTTSKKYPCNSIHNGTTGAIVRFFDTAHTLGDLYPNPINIMTISKMLLGGVGKIRDDRRDREVRCNGFEEPKE